MSMHSWMTPQGPLAELLDHGFITNVGRSAMFAPRRIAVGLSGEHIRNGVQAAEMRLRSVDDYRRRFASDPDEYEWSSAEMAFDHAYIAVREHIDATMARTKFDGERDDELRLGHIGAHLALQRCLAGFRAARLLYVFGLNPEGDAIVRQTLEQIAWAYAADPLEDLDAIDRVSSSKAIGVFKKAAGEGVGRFYGELNRWAHMGRAEHHRSLEAPGDTRIDVYENRQELNSAAGRLLVLADWWVIAWEWVHREFMESFESIASVEPLVVATGRPFLATMHQLASEVDESTLVPES
jgi:hypothetical protein